MKTSLGFLPLNFWMLSLLLHQPLDAVDTCPKGCYCFNSIIDCQSPSFPMQLPNGVIKIVNIRGKITNLPSNAFNQPSGSILKQLSINQNEISKIESHAFNNLFVDHFNFYNVKIKSLEARIFANFSCNHLSIYNCVLNRMPAFLFQGLKTENMNIYNNNITTLETNVFQLFTVKTTAFYHNKINRVQKNAFKTNFKINIYLNTIETFEKQNEAQPNSFHSNLFQCFCSLTWMWEAGSVFSNFLEDNRCIGTEKKWRLSEIHPSSLCKAGAATASSESSNSKETPPKDGITRQSIDTSSANQNSSSKELDFNFSLIISLFVWIWTFILIF